MTEYCSATDVSNRLTGAGYLNLVNRDNDGSVSAAEIAAYVTPAIAWAGRKIDRYVVNRNPPYAAATLRGSANATCQDWCIDVAVWRIASNGGREIPECFQAAYDDAIKELEAIMEDGNVIPDAAIETDYNKNSNIPFEIQSQAVT